MIVKPAYSSFKMSEPSIPSMPEKSTQPTASSRWWPNLAQMGMIGWIASLVMFFAALILAFGITLYGVEIEEPIVIPTALWISTAILLASGITMIAGRYHLRRARVEIYRKYLYATTILGLAFVVSQILGAWNLFQQGIYTQANPRGSSFYAFTGIHGLHLIGGIGALIYLLRGIRGLTADEEQPLRKARLRAQISAWYWNFVVVSWLVLFGFLISWAQ